MLCYLKRTSCNIDDATLLNVNIISNMMLCYWKFTSCNKDDGAQLNTNFISNKTPLLKKLGSCSLSKAEGPEYHSSNGPRCKKAGSPANTNKFKAFKSIILTSTKNLQNAGFELLPF